jgi:hypothetical protein
MSFVAIDEQHIALPKLYGAPAYARPATIADEAPRPFDPDDLPIEAVMTDEEREIAATLPARVFVAGGTYTKHEQRHGWHGEPRLNPKPLSLRALAGRILGQADN